MNEISTRKKCRENSQNDGLPLQENFENGFTRPPQHKDVESGRIASTEWIQKGFHMNEMMKEQDD